MSIQEKQEIIQSVCNKTQKQAQVALTEVHPISNLPIAKTKPITADLTQIQILLNQETIEKLNELKYLYSHQIPDGNLNQLFTLIIGIAFKNHPKLRSIKKNPRNPIPIKTKRIIYARAQGQCEYQSPNNQRCLSKYQLEFDHILSVSQGGTNSINNLQLLCRTHNQFKVFKTHGFIYQKNQQSKAVHHTIDLNCKNRTAKPDIK